jgi:3-deoxy-manno-octulosonate cytidylyltransferase (CMP-KDO synthetase)
MALILGQSMIVRTLQQASKVKAFSKVICATEDLEIYELVKAHGFEAILTPNTFLTGSDRVAWVADQLALEWVINLQGDEPLIDIDLLEEMALALPKNKNCWLTSACPLLPEWENLASVVKVKVSKSGDVLAFARENQKKRRLVSTYRRLRIPRESITFVQENFAFCRRITKFIRTVASFP